MTEQEIQKKLQVIITSKLGDHLAPAESVKPESDLVHDFGADSLARCRRRQNRKARQ